MTGSCRIFPIIIRQDTTIVDLWCRHCGAEQEQLLPLTARPEMIEETVRCLGCSRTGFMTEK